MYNDDPQIRAMRLEAQRRQGIAFMTIAFLGFTYLTYRDPDRLVRSRPRRKLRVSLRTASAPLSMSTELEGSCQPGPQPQAIAFAQGAVIQDDKGMLKGGTGALVGMFALPLVFVRTPAARGA